MQKIRYISTTLDVYSHLMPGDEESIISAISGYYDKDFDTVREGKQESQKEHNKQVKTKNQAK